MASVYASMISIVNNQQGAPGITRKHQGAPESTSAPASTTEHQGWASGSESYMVSKYVSMVGMEIIHQIRYGEYVCKYGKCGKQVASPTVW